jgi:hypothetical protein
MQRKKAIFKVISLVIFVAIPQHLYSGDRVAKNLSIDSCFGEGFGVIFSKSVKVRRDVTLNRKAEPLSRWSAAPCDESGTLLPDAEFIYVILPKETEDRLIRNLGADQSAVCRISGYESLNVRGHPRAAKPSNGQIDTISGTPWRVVRVLIIRECVLVDSKRSSPSRESGNPEDSPARNGEPPADDHRTAPRQPPENPAPAHK